MCLRLILAGLAALVSVSGALAHETWIEPVPYQVPAGATVTADIRNGQRFVGFSQPFFETRIARLDHASGDTVSAVAGRTGDIPAISVPDAPDGLMRLIYQSTPSKLTYLEWEKFTDFVTHKDLGPALARHDARGLPRTGFAERFTRYVKALVGVGKSGGMDSRAGLEIELVAGANPYTSPGLTHLPVQLFYGDAPRAAQIEVFERAPDGTVRIFTLRADSAGRAEVPVQPGHAYLVDSVVLRELDGTDPDRAVWESLWAALTFAVPG